MPNVIVSPNMSLPVPNLTDPGPDYATNVNASLDIVDGHTHTGAPTDGLQLDLSRQTCAGDVQLNDHNLGTSRSLEFVSQPGDLTGSQDVNCLCVVNNVLGFNNSVGTFLPLTGSSTAPITNFTPIAVTTNHVILPSDTYNVIDCNAASPITITLPAIGAITPNPIGRWFFIRDTSGAAATNPITIAVASASGNTFPTSGTTATISSNFGYMAFYTDGISFWYAWTQNAYGQGDVLNLRTGAVLNVDTGATVNVASGAAVGLTAGSTLTAAGAVGLTAGSTLTAAGAVGLTAGSTLTAAGTATVTGALTIDAAATLNINSVVRLGTASIALTTGTVTLSTSQYNSPILNFTGTLTGDVTVVFPNIVGAVWLLNCASLAVSGHTLSVQVGASALALETTGTVNYGTTPFNTFANWLIIPVSNAIILR